MAKHKIGITEAGDAGLDLVWTEKLNRVDGAIIITKNITPEFHRQVLVYAKNIIVHVSITGYGGTILEPNIPTYQDEIAKALSLIEAGFPQKKIVIRVDPIIPTTKGLSRATDVFTACMDAGFSRYRISVIDMYKHVQERFRAKGLPLPYGQHKYASGEQLEDVDEMVSEMETYWMENCSRVIPLRVESCAEPFLKQPIPCGCISSYDLSLLGVDSSNIDCAGLQREHCMCYSGKTELLSGRRQCDNQCLYCYWRN